MLRIGGFRASYAAQACLFSLYPGGADGQDGMFPAAYDT